MRTTPVGRAARGSPQADPGASRRGGQGAANRRGRQRSQIGAPSPPQPAHRAGNARSRRRPPKRCACCRATPAEDAGPGAGMRVAMPRHYSARLSADVSRTYPGLACDAVRSTSAVEMTGPPAPRPGLPRPFRASGESFRATGPRRVARHRRVAVAEASIAPAASSMTPSAPRANQTTPVHGRIDAAARPPAARRRHPRLREEDGVHPEPHEHHVDVVRAAAARGPRPARARPAHQAHELAPRTTWRPRVRSPRAVSRVTLSAGRRLRPPLRRSPRG